MRFLFPLVMIVAASSATIPAKTPPLQKPTADCPRATSHFTRNGSVWTHDPVKPRKLAELPPAESYAAVYRLDGNGCMVPVKFRDVRP